MTITENQPWQAPNTYHLSSTTYHVLPTTYHLPPTSYPLPPTTSRPQNVVCLVGQRSKQPKNNQKPLTINESQENKPWQAWQASQSSEPLGPSLFAPAWAPTPPTARFNHMSQSMNTHIYIHMRIYIYILKV